MKSRSVLSILVVGVLLLLLLAGGSLYWILSQSPLSLFKGGVLREPAAAVLVPRQAPVMISMLVNPSSLESFSQLNASSNNRKRSRREILAVEKSLLAKTGLDYEKEVQPWLGDEITLAVTSLDIDRNLENGAQPGYLLAVNTKDEQLATEFLQVSYSKQAIDGTSDLVFEQYKGINLIYQRSRDNSSNTVALGSTAVVGDFVLFANSPKVLRDAINNIQVPDLNLKNASYYQQALHTIAGPRIGVVYANLPALSAWIGKSTIPETPEVSQMLALTFAIKSGGLVAQTALIGVKGEKNQPPALTQPVGALRYVPSNSIFTAAGTDLNQFWTQIETGLEADSPLQQLLKQLINRVQAPLGLKLPEDIFNWVKGEYSLALVPNRNEGEPDWIFITEKMPETEKAFTHLDELAQQQGYSVGNLPLLDTSVTAWTKLTTSTGTKTSKLTRLEAQVRGVHTQSQEYAIFSTSVEAMAQALTASETSLVNSEKFQQATSALPTDNDGYFYLDWNQSEPIIEQKLPIIRVIELAGKPLFKNLRSLTLSSQGAENGIRRATIFFNLGVRN